jgi:uncharacterized protein YbaR (Trm112 family)
MASPRQPLPLDLLCCPRCRGPLAPNAAWSCAGCAVEFPEVDGLPWLFADPAGVLGEWRGRTHAFLAELEAQADHYRSALGPDVTRAATRNRLKLLAAACSDHARRLRALLAPLGHGSAAAPDLYRALGVGLPSSQGLGSYYANLHRDWCWGEAENEASFRLLDQALGGSAPGRTLLLGVGAGRLAYDLHQRRRPQTLIAADLNPLFLLAARRLLAGESIELYEFPVAPRDIDSHAILRRLQAPAPAAEGLHLVFADVTDGPFAAGAFDTVVTPWLIDIVDEDLAVFARRINGWLRPGGRWVNSGSLSFAGDDPARRYSLEEVLDVVAAAGFTVELQREDTVPYLGSPASRHARLETVVTFAAVKREECAVTARTPRSPEWLERTDLPVPLLPEFAGRQLELRVLAYVASLVDGRRSIRDVARVLVEQRLMSADEAEPTVRGFLRRLHAETRARAASQPSL